MMPAPAFLCGLRKHPGGGQHGTIEPPGEQAGDDDHRGQRDRWHQGTRGGEPQRETWPVAEHGDDGRVDGTIEPVRRGRHAAAFGHSI